MDRPLDAPEQAVIDATEPRDDRVNLWLDDKKDPRLAGMFGLEDEGPWEWVTTSQDAKLWLAAGLVKTLAIDNDLGMLSDQDGRDVLHWLLERVLDGGRAPEKMFGISFNPVASDELAATINDIKRVLKLKEV